MATEDLAYVLAEMGIGTGMDLQRLLEASELLAYRLGHSLPGRIDRSLLAAPDVAR